MVDGKIQLVMINHKILFIRCDRRQLMTIFDEYMDETLKIIFILNYFIGCMDYSDSCIYLYINLTSFVHDLWKQRINHGEHVAILFLFLDNKKFYSIRIFIYRRINFRGDQLFVSRYIFAFTGTLRTFVLKVCKLKAFDRNLILLWDRLS